MQTIKAELVSGMTMNRNKSSAALDDGAAPLDENEQVLAAMEEEEATNTQPWWERSPWGGKEQGYWYLIDIEFYIPVGGHGKSGFRLGGIENSDGITRTSSRARDAI
jgi:hypothetical protein